MSLLLLALLSCRTVSAPSGSAPDTACLTPCSSDTGRPSPSGASGDTALPTPTTPTDPKDRDGDGVPVPDDCDDDDPHVHPGAVDDAGDAFDRNCDGADGMAGAYAVGPWWHADFGSAIVAGDWDGDGRDEIAVGAMGSTTPVYDDWIDGGAVVFTDENLQGPISLVGGPESRGAGERMVLTATPDGPRLLITQQQTDFGAVYVVDPTAAHVDRSPLEVASETTIPGSDTPDAEERVRYISAVRDEVWLATEMWDDVIDGTGRVVRLDLPFGGASPLDAPLMGTETPGYQLGYNAAGTADGTLVSQQEVDAHVGQVHWFGAGATDFSPASATRNWVGPHPFCYFGIAVTTVADEGRTLAVVSATGDDSDHFRGGRVYVLDPEAQDASLQAAVATIHAGEEASWMGYALLAGDFDGDGVEDLMVSAPADPYYSYKPGAVYLFHGPLRGDLFPDDADWSWLGTQPGELTGSALASGDFDGDGALDLLIGRLDFSTPDLEQTGRVDRVLNTEMQWAP